MFPVWVSCELESMHDPAGSVRDFRKWSLRLVLFVLAVCFLTGVFSTRQTLVVVKEMICRFKAGSLDPSHVNGKSKCSRWIGTCRQTPGIRRVTFWDVMLRIANSTWTMS